MNVAEDLANEIDRNRKLLEVYKAIPTGAFGAKMIDAGIKRAIEALASGDAVEIIIAYEDMKSNE